MTARRRLVLLLVLLAIMLVLVYIVPRYIIIGDPGPR